MRTTPIKKSMAMSGAMFIALMGATAPADAASSHQGKGQPEKAAHAEKADKGTKAEKADKGAKADKAAKPAGRSHASSTPTSPSKPASHGSQGATSAGSTHGNSGQTATQGGGKGGDPAGNNGTVKVDDDPWLGPNGHGGSNPSNGVGNDPHVGCNFQVEWYGFDQGDDIISTVTFEMQSPTKDVVLGGYTPTQVFVGEDPAGGGTDLDAKQTYTLSFDGAPQAKHGYHVKLTINTPGSIGADVKHKVFWVEGCGDTPGTPGTPGTPPEVKGEQGHSGKGGGVEVKGEQATAGKPSQAVRAAQAVVPTVVESGLAAVGTTADAATSEWPLAVGALGLGLLGAGAATRRRARR